MPKRVHRPMKKGCIYRTREDIGPGLNSYFAATRISRILKSVSSKRISNQEMIVRSLLPTRRADPQLSKEQLDPARKKKMSVEIFHVKFSQACSLSIKSITL